MRLRYKTQHRDGCGVDQSVLLFRPRVKLKSTEWCNESSADSITIGIIVIPALLAGFGLFLGVQTEKWHSDLVGYDSPAMTKTVNCRALRAYQKHLNSSFCQEVMQCLSSHFIVVLNYELSATEQNNMTC